MINNLRTSLLLPAELAQTVSAYLALVDKSMPDEPLIGRITTMLNDDLDHLNQAMTAVRRNAFVDDVFAADAVRDDFFIGFRDLVDAYRRRKKPDIRRAHEKAWNLIEKAGTRLYKLGYTEQSGRLEALFAEFDKAENQEALAQLKVTDVYDELKQAQADFIALYNERLNADAGMDFPTLQEAKARMVPHVNSLLNVLRVMHETEPEKYTELADHLNTITKQVMTAARARQTRATGETDEVLV